MVSADYKRMALDKLTGHWGMAIAVSLVAGLLGANFSSSYSFSGSRSLPDDLDLEDLRHLNTLVDSTFTNLASEGYKGPIEALFSEIPEIMYIVTIVFALSMAWTLTTFIISGATKSGVCAFNRKLYTARGAQFSDLFLHYDILGKTFLTSLLMQIFITLWTLLFIIPGIIATYAYSMTYYILDEHPDMKPMEAIRRSKELMRGHKWEYFCLQFSFIGWWILSIFTLGIGFLFLSPYMEQANYVFYYNIAHGIEYVPTYSVPQNKHSESGNAQAVLAPVEVTATAMTVEDVKEVKEDIKLEEKEEEREEEKEPELVEDLEEVVEDAELSEETDSDEEID